MTNRSLGIDLLRVISIALVVFSHYGLLENFLLTGTHGVTIFFMVSGYCMHYSLQNRSGAQFLFARFWRLIPTLFICASLTTFTEINLPELRPDRLHTFDSYVANIVCLPTGNLICDLIYDAWKGQSVQYLWVDGAYWSLLVEIRFYLLLWFLYYIARQQRPAIIISALGLFACLNLDTSLISKSQDFLIYMPFFAFGMSWRAWIDNKKYSAVGMLMSLAIFMTNVAIGSNGISIFLNSFNVLGYGICFAIFIASVALFTHRYNKFVSYMGVLSYPLYLLHQDLGLMLIAVLENSTGKIVAAILTIFVMLMLAATVQSFIDLTAPIVKRSFVKRWPLPNNSNSIDVPVTTKSINRS